jgi:serine/threonine protein kinase
VFDSKKYSIESDVWSLGVVMWEMFSFGAEPYEFMSNKDVVKFVKNGSKLECPECCPPVIYEEVILPCWNLQPAQRPTFKTLFRLLENIHKMMDSNAGKDDIFDDYDTGNLDGNVDENTYKVTP